MKNEISKNINKGVELLSEALTQYESGNDSIAYTIFKNAEKYLTEANKRALTNEGKLSMKYGENLNFGVIYKIFESNTKNLMSSNNGKKSLKKIVNYIKENKVLKDEFAIYNAITNPINVSNVEEYVNEAVNLTKHYNKNILKEENRKLIKLIKQCKLDENIYLDDKDIELFEGIEYIICNDKTLNNVNDYANIKSNLYENVRNSNKVLKESVSLDKLYNEKLNEIANKHLDELNSDELDLIMEVNNPDKATKLFNQHKSNVIALIKEQIEKNEDVESWGQILEKITSKNFDKNSAITDIAEFIEIQNEINE